jgi:hypothetical protein
MRHYRATNKITNEVVEYDAEAAQAEHLGADWFLELMIQAADPVGNPEPDPPPPYTGPWTITRLAFINRFTDAEWIAFDLTALDNPTGTPTERQQKSAMRLFMKKVELAQFIDLSRTDTRTGVQTLEAVGILGAGRALEMLDTPPTYLEVWNA